jgi:hypothetical protein
MNMIRFLPILATLSLACATQKAVPDEPPPAKTPDPTARVGAFVERLEREEHQPPCDPVPNGHISAAMDAEGITLSNASNDACTSTYQSQAVVRIVGTATDACPIGQAVLFRPSREFTDGYVSPESVAFFEALTPAMQKTLKHEVDNGYSYAFVVECKRSQIDFLLVGDQDGSVRLRLHSRGKTTKLSSKDQRLIILSEYVRKD